MFDRLDKKWSQVRRSEPIYVDAPNRTEAKRYVRLYHVPKFKMRPGESLIGVKAPMVSTAYVMEKMNQPRLL
jgi:hypothetical protein